MELVEKVAAELENVTADYFNQWGPDETPPCTLPEYQARAAIAVVLGALREPSATSVANEMMEQFRAARGASSFNGVRVDSAMGRFLTEMMADFLTTAGYRNIAAFERQHGGDG